MAKSTTKKATSKVAAASPGSSKATTRATTRATSKATTRGTSRGTSKRTTREAADSILGFPLKSWVGGLRRAKGAEARTGRRGFIYAFGQRHPKDLKRVLIGVVSKWQMQMLLESEADSVFFQGILGPVWILRAPQVSNRQAAIQPSYALDKPSYARFRDLAGAVVPQLPPFKVDKLVLETYGLSADEERGMIVGLEMAAYSYSENRPSSPKSPKSLPQLLLKTESHTFTDELIGSAEQLAVSINLARHLVNIPGAQLNPESYADAVDSLFAGSSTVEVDIWEGERLEEERMNLLLAVGAAATFGPRLVHLRYRPKSAPANVRPLAIVGKGITFDSGGLDIKPSSGMRWMKKDMGGSAAAVALMKWAESTNLPLPLDIYLSLAENGISGSAFRPGDIITARNGQTVEIHNTDAEGRLVMADALDVAVTQVGEDKPAAIIDIATLTGAIKVGLGAEIAGLFSNDDDLANLISEAALSRGDFVWRMPLYQPYRNSLKSTFADIVNAGDGFGGAITAALFLEGFVRGVPWAHLDIYAWKDGASGAWSESGGNGQPVQALTEVLTRLARAQDAQELA